MSLPLVAGTQLSCPVSQWCSTAGEGPPAKPGLATGPSTVSPTPTARRDGTHADSGRARLPGLEAWRSGGCGLDQALGLGIHRVGGRLQGEVRLRHSTLVCQDEVLGLEADMDRLGTGAFDLRQP